MCQMVSIVSLVWLYAYEYGIRVQVVYTLAYVYKKVVLPMIHYYHLLIPGTGTRYIDV